MSNNELKHYGVLGMKWGVRRARSSLAKANRDGDADRRKAAVNKLTKHKGKIQNKLDTLKTKNDKLNYKLERQIDKKSNKIDKYKEKSNNYRSKAVVLELKADKYERKIEKNKRKMGSFFSSPERITRLQGKNEKLQLKVEKSRKKANEYRLGNDFMQTKVSKITNEIDRTRTAITQNEALQSTYSRGMRDVDEALLNKGRSYLGRYR